MNDDRQIRSFHRAYTMETELHSIGDMRPWKPIPARGIFWLAAFEVAMIALVNLPPTSYVLGDIWWPMTYGFIPCGLAWLFTLATVEGRRFHVVVRSASKHAFRGRWMAGTFTKLESPGGHWKPSRVKVARPRKTTRGSSV